ncbi:RidA family protein [Algoriphagus litoralis]|uniref:RidA family protein n=1 Tax=Algoriphagus litoralis TaxID=2202829 RepID=UPI000DBA89F6|nr:RidA family protein [Algoriphagus litoralis]
MEKRIINPWNWQKERGYVQAVEVKQVEGTLYCSGQAAIGHDGVSSDASMKIQLGQALENLEKVILEAGYECKNIVRLNLFTTSTDELLTTCFTDFISWTKQNQVEAALTAVEVNSLYESLKIEFEAIVVK